MLRSLLLLALCLACCPCNADGPFGSTSGAKVVRPGGPVVSPSDGRESKAEKPEAGGAKKQDGEGPDATAKKSAESPEPKVIRRGSDGEADPDELKATVGADGKVAFQFRNQAWGELVQWLSDISGQPIDWLELPGDRVNLASPDRYTVAETLDLFNRHLIARGYTILELDGGLTIAKIATLDPAMVPRVDVRSLARVPPNSFVRATLDVGWLPAAKVAEEFALIVGPSGKLSALSTTNRLEAIGPAVNLLQVADLLEQERDSASRDALAPEFKLRHLPAEEAKRMLEEFLGVAEKKSAPMTPQQMQMMAQMRQQQQQQGVPQAEPKSEISIVANPRQNSVIIRAPIDRIAIANEFLLRIDVPGQSLMSLSDVEARVQVFRLQTLDPEKLFEIVSEMNVLEPTTRIRTDNDNRALVVNGSPADRFIIGRLIERLDGSGRQFEVLQLRRLDANDVAESIAFLMGQEQEEDDSRSSRRYGYYGFYGNNEQEDKQQDEFRVAANARFRQVLLWANDREMEQVESLLVKLGELPPPGGSSRTLRVIDASATPETYEYLQRLKQQWNRIAPNPLEIPDATQFKDPIKDDRQDASDASAADPPESNDDKQTAPDDEREKSNQPPPVKQPATEDETVAMQHPSPGYQLTRMQPPASDPDETSPRSEIQSADDFDRMFRDRDSRTQSARETSANEAVRIELDDAGNLILMSPDTKALDRLENLMLQIKPPQRPYHVFKIKHASSYWIKLNLEEYFVEEDGDQDSTGDNFYRWYFGMNDESEEGPAGLGRGSSLRFVEDPDTNTIVVSGATAEQLRTIDELIELWDVEESVNKRKMRFTRLITLKYGQADKIADTIKDAYRDLLSSNDKAFQAGRGGQNPQGGNQKQNVPRNREGNGSGLVDENGQEGGGADFSFKGKLSIGVDKIGNTMILSAEGESLLELVSDMIEQLDEAARPAGEVEVLQLSGDVSTASIQRALEAFGAKTAENEQPNSRDRVVPRDEQ